MTPLQIWFSSDRRYAVAEIFTAEYFVAGSITEADAEDEIPVLQCKDSFSTDPDEVDFRGYSVDWSMMIYGFCKLRSRSIENGEVRTFRIYFEPKTYIRKYEEVNGVPYSGQKNSDDNECPCKTKKRGFPEIA